MMEEISAEYWFLAAVSVFAVVGWGLLQYFFRRAENQRADYVSNLTRFVPTEVETSAHRNPKKAREQAIEFIAARFSLFRRTLGPAFLLFCVLLGTIPFLDRIPATLVSIFLGAVTVTLGILARPFLENMVSGLLISFTQPIRTGDIIEIDGKFGLIEDIGVSHTTVKLWNWSRYLIANTEILRTKFTNFTLHDRYLWADIIFWVAPDSDLNRVQEIANQTGKQLQKEHDLEGEIGFWIVSENQTGIQCWIAFWVKHPIEAWNLKTELRIRLSEAFKKNGIFSHRYFVGNLSSQSFTPETPQPAV